MTASISARPASAAELAGVEPVLEDFDLPEVALEKLAELTGVDPNALRTEAGWTALVTLEGTQLLLRAIDQRWSIFAVPEEDDAMSAARKLHGLLGEKPEGWDLDR